MNVLSFGAGVVLLVAVVADLLWTTLWVEGGAGPVTARLMSTVWRGFRAAGSRGSRLLTLAGPVILMATLGTWVGLLWGGWTLVFGGGEPALLDTRAREPVTLSGRVYFVAYTLFTMGNGDFTPAGPGWQLATALATASGMLFVTLAVSYVLSVLGAVVQKRSFAGSVTGLGSCSEAVVTNGWTGEGFDGLDRTVARLASDLETLATRHRAYPILHYYHSDRGSNAAAMAVAVLDDATTLLRDGVPAEARPIRAHLESAQSSVDSYLRTLDGAFIDPADEVPPPPDLERVREAGVPTVPDEAFADAVADRSERRRTLLGAVEADAWHWPPVDD